MTSNKTDPLLKADAVSSRRATLERQSSIGRLLAASDGIGKPKSPLLNSINQALSSRHSAPSSLFDVPNLSRPMFNLQDPFQFSAADKSGSGGGSASLSKAGGKKKQPAKPGKHVCQYCGKLCAKPSVLEKHIRKHTGERPFPCNICDLSFKTKSNLYKHRKSLSHGQKCHGKGLSLGSTQGESFGSSRDESMELTEEAASSTVDDDNHSNPYSRSGSFGSTSSDIQQLRIDSSSLEKTPSTVCGYSPAPQPSTHTHTRLLIQSQPSNQPPTQPHSRCPQVIYLDTLRQLEQTYDAIDSYAIKRSLVVIRRAHWLLDKDCIVSIQLQQQQQQQLTCDADVGNDAKLPSTLQQLQPASKDETAESSVQRIDKLLRDNDEIFSNPVHEMPKRRLSRQSSVSSPATQMFISDKPAATTSSSSTHNTQQPLSCDTMKEPQSDVILPVDLPDGEELFKRLHQIIHQNSMIDPNIKLLLHKHCMEVKLKLSIPDVSMRRKWGQIQASEDIVLTTGNMKLVGGSFICVQCKTSFSRRHILEIHLAFYCHGDHGKQSISGRFGGHHHSFDEIAAEKKKMKLLKTGSEDSSYTYIMADDEIGQWHKFNRSKSDMPLTDRASLLHQHSSTDSVVSDGITTKEYLKKQYLKKRLLKHLSHGSVGAKSQSSGLGLGLADVKMPGVEPGVEQNVNCQSLAPGAKIQSLEVKAPEKQSEVQNEVVIANTGSSVNDMPSHSQSNTNTQVNLYKPNFSDSSLKVDTVSAITPRMILGKGEPTRPADSGPTFSSCTTTFEETILPLKSGQTFSGKKVDIEAISTTAVNTTSTTAVCTISTTALNTISTTAVSTISTTAVSTLSATTRSTKSPIAVSIVSTTAVSTTPSHSTSNFSTLRSSSDICRQTACLTNQGATIQSSSSSVNGPVSSVSGPVSSVNGPVSSVSGPVSSVNGPVSSVNGPVSSVNGPVSSVNGPVSSQSNTLTSITFSGQRTTSYVKPIISITFPVADKSAAPILKIKDPTSLLQIPQQPHPLTSINEQSKMVELVHSAPQTHVNPSPSNCVLATCALATCALATASNKLQMTTSAQICAVDVQEVGTGTNGAAFSKSSNDQTPTEQRLSILRRRFSQSRSQSSVSFDESANKAYEIVTSSQQCSPGPSIKTLTKSASKHCISNPAHAMQCNAIGILTNSTKYHPITYQLMSSSLPKRCDGVALQQRNGGEVTTSCKTISSECHVSYYTLHHRIASATVSSGLSSSYSLYRKHKAPQLPSPWIDMSMAMSCYQLQLNSSVNGYANSSMDTRHILTHSSYWEYTNNMRVMQSMPIQIRASSQVTSKQFMVNADIKPIHSSISPLTTLTSPLAKSILSNTSKPDSDAEGAVVTRPSVITTDIHQNRKKLLLRSQSTPNAGGADSQSKLIAGGFKSDEDYVYIRGRGKGKYVCQQCGIRCRKPSMLRKHIRTHTDLRPYSCKHCNFSFKTKGNLTKHMRSKAHHRRCLELNIVPVPSTVDDSQIDKDILASQQKLSRKSKIKGTKMDDGEDNEVSDVSDDDEDENDNSSDEESSVDDALHIDEDMEAVDEAAIRFPETGSLTLPPMNSTTLRRVHSMPAHHMANSFDASSLADMQPEEPEVCVSQAEPPATKKKKRNPLNLTIPLIRPDQLANTELPQSSSKIEDDIARSLLDLSQTPVHGTTTPKPLLQEFSLLGVATGVAGSPVAADIAGVKRVSVVRSTKQSHHYQPENNDEPMDLRVQPKAAKLKYMCKLCRAICCNQDSLDVHMKLHNGPVIEVLNRSVKRLSSHSVGSFEQDISNKQAVNKVQTPQTPNPLRRQHAISLFDSDIEEDGVDHQTKVEPGEKLSESISKRKCPYCAKVFLNENYLPLHVKSHHLITQEYVCTYKDCGDKFLNKQDLTYHLGTHALDDNDKYQPISIPKCGICEKTFKSISSLKQHIQHHAEARPHVCEYCDAGFTTAQSLKHHLKTHTQERPYVCGECGATFARSDHLTQHNKTHKKNLVSAENLSRSHEHPTILNPAGNASSLHTALQ